MKTLKITLCICLLFSFLSCEDDDSNDTNIIGTWKFGSLFVDGFESTASGTISFEDATNGQMDLWYVVENDTLTKSGNFTYTANAEEVSILLNSNTEVWRRAVNLSDEQEFHFDETINSIEYNLSLIHI